MNIVLFTFLPLLAMVISAVLSGYGAWQLRDWRPVLFVALLVLMSVHQVNEIRIFIETGRASGSMGFGEYPETAVNLLASIAVVSIIRFVKHERELSEQLSAKLAREQELEERNERLDRFAGVTAHDLRNPLNVIKSRAVLLREDQSDRAEHLDEIESATDRMGTLIDNLLALARQDDSIEELSSVEVSVAAREAWSHVETDDATLAIHTDGLVIRADRPRLVQLLENLFHNSVEHGGSDVSVVVEPLTDGFSVADDGPGIPPAERNNIFDAGETTDPDGTGFGLAIVNRIVDAHGGEIRVANGPDGGAKFEIHGFETLS